MHNLVAASAVFLGIHFLVSGTRLRDVLVTQLGERTYRGLFSVASLGGLIWMIYAYRNAPTLALWNPAPVGRPLAYALVFVAFLLAVIGLATPGVTGVGMESKLAEPSGNSLVRGVTRITRHPFLWGVALWAVAHLLENGDLASAVLFGSLLILAVGGTMSIDAKRRRMYPAGWSDFTQATSSVPFLAIITGRNNLFQAMREIGVVRPLAAIVAYVLIFWFHGRLFGAPLH